MPCKLCGGKSTIRKVEELDGYCHYDDWLIRCEKCRTMMRFAADNYYGRDYLSEDEAVAKWNELHSGILRCRNCQSNHECSIQAKYAYADDEENWYCGNAVSR